MFEEVAEAEAEGGLPLDEQEVTGGTLFGLSMFGTLFLGAVLAAFLTLGVVLEMPSAVSYSRSSCARSGAACCWSAASWAPRPMCVPYVLAVYAACALITRAAGDWWPDQFLRSGLQLAVAVLLIAALGVLGRSSCPRPRAGSPSS